MFSNGSKWRLVISYWVIRCSSYMLNPCLPKNLQIVKVDLCNKAWNEETNGHWFCTISSHHLCCCEIEYHLRWLNDVMMCQIFNNVLVLKILLSHWWVWIFFIVFFLAFDLSYTCRKHFYQKNIFECSAIYNCN